MKEEDWDQKRNTRDRMKSTMETELRVGQVTEHKKTSETYWVNSNYDL